MAEGQIEVQPQTPKQGEIQPLPEREAGNVRDFLQGLLRKFGGQSAETIVHQQTHGPAENPSLDQLPTAKQILKLFADENAQIGHPIDPDNSRIDTSSVRIETEAEKPLYGEEYERGWWEDWKRVKEENEWRKNQGKPLKEWGVTYCLSIQRGNPHEPGALERTAQMVLYRREPDGNLTGLATLNYTPSVKKEQSSLEILHFRHRSFRAASQAYRASTS